MNLLSALGANLGTAVLQGLIDILQTGFALYSSIHPFENCHGNCPGTNQSESGGDQRKLLELACLLPIECWYIVGRVQMLSWMESTVQSIGLKMNNGNQC